MKVTIGRLTIRTKSQKSEQMIKQNFVTEWKIVSIPNMSDFYAI